MIFSTFENLLLKLYKHTTMQLDNQIFDLIEEEKEKSILIMHYIIQDTGKEREKKNKKMIQKKNNY